MSLYLGPFWKRYPNATSLTVTITRYDGQQKTFKCFPDEETSKRNVVCGYPIQLGTPRRQPATTGESIAAGVIKISFQGYDDSSQASSTTNLKLPSTMTALFHYSSFNVNPASEASIHPSSAHQGSSANQPGMMDSPWYSGLGLGPAPYPYYYYGSPWSLYNGPTQEPLFWVKYDPPKSTPRSKKRSREMSQESTTTLSTSGSDSSDLDHNVDSARRR